MEASYIIAPLLGGVIGYITNDIAIRMSKASVEVCTKLIPPTGHLYMLV